MTLWSLSWVSVYIYIYIRKPLSCNVAYTHADYICIHLYTFVFVYMYICLYTNICVYNRDPSSVHKTSITGNIYNIIKSMYANARYSVMINGSTSPQFISTSGVKQGCSMSPILSNLFQNDIHDIFNDTDCDPVKLHETHLYNISLADDLLYLSCSREGLQKCLDNLSDYCEKWGLLVNEKNMIFTKSKWTPEKLHYGNSEIECVKSIQYLGFDISYSFNIKVTIQDRQCKA